MKTVLTFAFILFCTQSFSQASLLVGQGSYLTGGDNTYIVLSGDLRVDGNVNTSTSSSFNFNGTTQQKITCVTGSGCTYVYSNTTYPVTLGNILQNNSSGITVEINTLVNGTHTFSSSSTEIKEGMLWLTKTSGAYSGNNSTGNFFVTTGHGLLKQSTITAGRLFPIGSAANSSNYTPATIAYSGTADNFALRVFDNIYYAYDNTNGAPIGTTTNTRFVKKTWIVNKDTRTVGDAFSPTLQWNGVNEDVVFAARRPTDVTIGRNHDATWFPNAQIPASGSDPYTLSGTVTYDASGYEYYPISATAINVVLATSGLILNAALNNNNIILQWNTLTEVNSVHFEIERSINGTDFTSIAKLSAAGNSNALKKYNYNDLLFPLGNSIIYYRVKEVDKDNHITLSNIATVKPGNVKAGVIIFPNPVSDYIHLLFRGLYGDYRVKLTDISGRIISLSTTHTAGSGSLKIPCAGIAAGHYFIQVSNQQTFNQTYHITIFH